MNAAVSDHHPKVNLVLRRLRRPVLVLLPVVLAASLTACGNEDGDGGSTGGGRERLEAVEVSGDPGTQPEVEWKGRMEAGDVETETLVEGEGPVVEDGDQVVTNIWIGNGYTQEQAYSTYESGQTETVTVGDDLSPIFAEAFEGQTIGSRVAVTASADEAFGEAGNPQLNLANKDSVLVIIDLVGTVLDGPEGTEQPEPAWAPNLIVKQKLPKAFGWRGVPEPTAGLRSALLIEGEGQPVEKGDTITVNYLGQVYGAEKPFDESYSKGTPASFQIGTGAVIKGWDQTLVGVPVGSRVIMAIPPKLGYGTAGNEGAGIKGTDTLYFLVDVLAAG